MKRAINFYTQTIIALAVACLSLCASAADGYIPAVTFQNFVSNVTVKKNGSYQAVVERTILIETEQGVSSSGEVDIAYIPKYSNVKILAAYTIRANGTRIDVPKKNIHVTNDTLNKGGSSYSDQKHVVLIFPKVEIGSRLYLKYIKNVTIPVFNNQYTFRRVASPEFRFEPLEFKSRQRNGRAD
jgi:hypothetical protein